MECCHEGTLWSIAQQGLPEHMIRRYTRDLLRAVDLLHSKGIIHRDIKGQYCERIRLSLIVYVCVVIMKINSGGQIMQGCLW